MTLPTGYSRTWYFGWLSSGIALAATIFIMQLFGCDDTIDPPRGRYPFDVTRSARASVGFIANDSPKVQKQYLYVITMTPESWKATVDTLNYVNDQIGKALNVDQANQLKSWYFSVIGRMYMSIKLDSVVSRPKK